MDFTLNELITIKYSLVYKLQNNKFLEESEKKELQELIDKINKIIKV